MADAVDTPVRRRPRDKDPEETPQANAQRDQAKIKKNRKTYNTVVEKYYELRAGTKLVFVKVLKTGSKHSTFVGNMVPADKKNKEDVMSAASVKRKVEELKAKGELRIKI